MTLKPGDVYISKRIDTFDIKDKFQIYFADDLVLLINSHKSRFNCSIYIRKNECPFLEYDSYICIDNVFNFDKTQKVIKKEELPTEVLKRIKNSVLFSSTLTTRTIRRIQEIIEQTIYERESLTSH